MDSTVFPDSNTLHDGLTTSPKSNTRSKENKEDMSDQRKLINVEAITKDDDSLVMQKEGEEDYVKRGFK